MGSTWWRHQQRIRWYAAKRKREADALAPKRDLVTKSSGWFKSLKGYHNCREVYLHVRRCAGKHVSGYAFLLYPKRGAEKRYAWLAVRDFLERWQEISEEEGRAVEAALEL